MFLGFQEVAATHFDSVTAHVHWVYCAYILLRALPPPRGTTITSLAEKQRYVKAIVGGKERARIIQLLTQFNGPERFKKELQAVQEELYKSKNDIN